MPRATIVHGQTSRRCAREPPSWMLSRDDRPVQETGEALVGESARLALELQQLGESLFLESFHFTRREGGQSDDFSSAAKAPASRRLDSTVVRTWVASHVAYVESEPPRRSNSSASAPASSRVGSLGQRCGGQRRHARQRRAVPACPDIQHEPDGDQRQAPDRRDDQLEPVRQRDPLERREAVRAWRARHRARHDRRAHGDGLPVSWDVDQARAVVRTKALRRQWRERASRVTARYRGTCSFSSVGSP